MATYAGGQAGTGRSPPLGLGWCSTDLFLERVFPRTQGQEKLEAAAPGAISAASRQQLRTQTRTRAESSLPRGAGRDEPRAINTRAGPKGRARSCGGVWALAEPLGKALGALGGLLIARHSFHGGGGARSARPGKHREPLFFPSPTTGGLVSPQNLLRLAP